MLPVTAAQMREATNGTLYGDGNLTITALSTDSRQITPGVWFVPIVGEKFDGHDFIDKALERAPPAASVPGCRRLSGRIKPISRCPIPSGL